MDIIKIAGNTINLYSILKFFEIQQILILNYNNNTYTCQQLDYLYKYIN